MTAPQAAKLLGIDSRTVRTWIVTGKLRGGAQPRASRIRWYVYADQLRIAKGHEIGTPPRAGVDDQVCADLRAEVVRLREANLLLIAAQEDLQSAESKYRSALSLFMTPGHPGDL